MPYWLFINLGGDAMFDVIRKITVGTACILPVVAAPYAMANSQIRAVGSSTVYPFATVVAENVSHATGDKAAVVESTGTGGGFKLFCSGAGEGTPDLANASRPITDSEKTLCEHNKVGGITEIKIGYDGIVIANSAAGQKFKLTKENLFNALARKVSKDGKLVENPYTLWNEIDAKLPATKIEVYGPPPTSGTRDAFVELVIEGVCKNKPEFKAAYADEAERKKACQQLREDGAFIEAGENDNLIVQKLTTNKQALGIFGFSFLDANPGAIQASDIDGVLPSFETIVEGKYSVSRPLFIYAKNAHLKITKGLDNFIKELISDKAIGQEGYLVTKGLIPLSEAELEEVRTKVGQVLK
jgi:phosphate transport system substrate-binding protein